MTRKLLLLLAPTFASVTLVVGPSATAASAAPAPVQTTAAVPLTCIGGLPIHAVCLLF
jgi:hypothetical protein